METRIARLWKERDVYGESLRQRAGAPEWVFYEGPPTANGKPGIHHVEARIFKDLFCRFQTMRGHLVPRQGGWDCHGLPVEVSVEKELGITSKREIEERIGIEEFTRRCRESVKRYVDDWERITERIGFWLDLDGAYWTMSPDYVESVWWLLRQIWDQGLLEEDFKVVPYCPRCETALSAHELGQPDVYRRVSDPSVFVRFPLAEDPRAALLVWTTTPWTLLANMAAAVGPDIPYVRVADPEGAGDVIVARARLEALWPEGATVIDEMTGADLVGLRYRPPFGFVEPGGSAHTVMAGDFVTTEDGTGIVHLAPYGEADMAVARREGLPIEQMIDGSGRVVARGAPFSGLWVKDADPKIVADLEERGLLWRAERLEHPYPHCWRCHTPLLYYPRKDWYIRTSRRREELLASNEEVNWQPPTIKHGRFGDWLANNVDWSLSRDRYWGTPLPVWRCESGHTHCVGSFAELARLSGRDLEGFDPHRPYVDAVTFPCPECSGVMSRVASVIDAWFDSGSMPWGQLHYPFANKELFERRFPAHFISEGLDQTRGWFYSLLAIATLVEGRSSYRNVVCLGLIVDARGRKMSKSLGNALDPWSVLNAQGADPLRWYMIVSGNPWSARRTSSELIEESLRKHLLTLWNTYSFWVTYAAIEDFVPRSSTDAPRGERAELDRWILAELDDCTRTVTDALEAFDATTAGRRIERFVDDLSNWYVRRTRRRFWRSKEESETRDAFQTLWECLVGCALLSAPLTPFVADEMYTNLVARLEDAPASVHLAPWPEPPKAARGDDELRGRMHLARRLVGLGRSARTDAKVRVRQPLRRALVVLPPHEPQELGALAELVKEELNVRDIELVSGLDELVTLSVRPNFRALGPRLGARVKDVAAALASCDASALVRDLRDRGEAEVTAGGKRLVLGADDLDVRVEGRSGLALAQDGAYGVALDLELSDELVAEGIAREVVRGVQDLRKSSGLAVTDRIELWLDGDPAPVNEALRQHQDAIAGEVLAVTTRAGRAHDGAARAEITVEGGTVHVALTRAARA